MKKIITVLVLFCVVLTGCKKSGGVYMDMSYPTYKIPDNLKKWTIYKPGSYWVYLNEKTQVIDCTSFKHGPYDYIDGGIEYNWFFVRGPFLNKIDVRAVSKGNAMVFIALNTPGIGIGLTNKTLIDTVNADTTLQWKYLDYSFVEHLDSTIINGNKFTNVFHTRTIFLSSYNIGYLTGYDYYWAKGVGLIRLTEKRTNGDTTWSLVRWNTVQ